jgi:hypothetical protein
MLLFDERDELVGVQFLAVREGIDLTDIPRSDEIVDAVRAFRDATAEFLPAATR